ncbi:MAG: hypothetical protein AB7U29_00780 [Desulfobulbus sp.]
MLGARDVNGTRMCLIEAAKKKTLALCHEGIKKTLLLQKQQTSRTAFMEIPMKESPVKLFQIVWHFETNG